VWAVVIGDNAVHRLMCPPPLMEETRAQEDEARSPGIAPDHREGGLRVLAATHGWWLLPLLAVLVAYRQSPQFGLSGDAAFLIARNPYLRGAHALWRNLVHDYFWSASGNGIPYWRPITKGSWVLEYWLWNGAAYGFHLVQVTWHLLATLGVALLARRWGAGRTGGAVAALLFGLNPNLIEPVCSIMARSDVVVGAAGIWTLIGFGRWQETRKGTWLVLHIAAWLVALGSKETAVTLLPVLALMNLARGTAAWPARIRALLPSGLAVALYFALRVFVLGARAQVPWRLHGERILLVGGQALYSLLPFHLWATATSVPKLPHATWNTLVPVALGWLALAGMAILIARRRSLTTAALVIWALASLSTILLISDLNVPTSPLFHPLSGRWVLMAVAASSLLASLGLDALGPRWPRLRLVLLGLVGVWSVFLLLRSGGDHQVFRDDLTLAQASDRDYLALPERLRSHADRCGYAERQVLRAIDGKDVKGALDRLDSTPRECLEETRFSLLRTRALVDAGRFPEAWQVAEPAIRTGSIEPRYHAEAYYLAGVAALAVGRTPDAEAYLSAALRMGHTSCNLPVKLGMTLAKLGKTAEAAASYESAATCVGGSDARPWLAAATLWMQAGRRAEAQGCLERVRGLALTPEQQAAVSQLSQAVQR
jgi:hypothetical protein